MRVCALKRMLFATSVREHAARLKLEGLFWLRAQGSGSVLVARRMPAPRNSASGGRDAAGDVAWVPTGAAADAQYRGERDGARDHMRLRNACFQQARAGFHFYISLFSYLFCC
jgi:hypothetical protein